MLKHGLSSFFQSRTLSAPVSTHLRALYFRAYSSSPTEEDIAIARKWLAKFNPDTLPKNIYEFSFSRSSGPGGQNVNKYNREYIRKFREWH